MLKNLKKRTEGFTIIEVLIVLAIAGLILLVVFLAVPALQRNSRNNIKRSEASRVIGAVSEFSASKGGRPPVASDITELTTLANLGTDTTIAPTIPTTVLGITTAPTAVQILIVTGVVCNPAAIRRTGFTLTAAQYQTQVNTGTGSSAVALYSLEDSRGRQVTQCQGS